MSSHCVINHWLIDIASGSLIHQKTGEQRRLGEYQFKLLLVLVEHAGQILTRGELNTLVWERRVIGNNSLPNAVHALRWALEDDGKQQRIIKTIPKKGYILEAEFCEFGIDGQHPDNKMSEHTLSSGTEDAFATRPYAREEWQRASQRESLRLTEQMKDKRQHFWRWMCLGQAILLVLVAGFLSLSHSGKNPDRLTEQQLQLYSQIRLFSLNRLNDAQMISEDIPGMLNATLFALNDLLIARHMTMQVFYSTTSSTLKYTLVVSSPCDHRQLAMNITQFRSNAAQLNTLIYRETERKINEMANCIDRPDGSDADPHRSDANNGSAHSQTESVRVIQPER
ncbi:transcriptional regulator [Erwinia tracheiphila]|nr:transcriptional regulator [Erwinia tracheiphila]UIA88851.1 transcriptional regulator [Erwinia tracheiphila]UIA91457.1 transcriptional regulator [Erwinia tracheiphila]UIA97232.1 transcriptional regulator [Erwinia tracheiphila]